MYEQQNTACERRLSASHPRGPSHGRPAPRVPACRRPHTAPCTAAGAVNRPAAQVVQNSKLDV